MNNVRIEDTGIYKQLQEAVPILVVEDNVGLRRLIQKRLERELYRVEVVECGADALEQLERLHEAILLLDYKLPDMTGRELVEQLVKEGKDVPFVIMTGHGDERVAVEMMKLGARDYLVKDHSLLEVLPQVMEQVYIQFTTERKLKEVKLALLESEERFKLLFNKGTDAIFVIEIDGGEPENLQEVNDIACTRLGYTREELLGLSWKQIELRNEKDSKIFSNEELTSQKHYLYEAFHLTKDERYICVENNVHLMELGGKTVLMCISRDITHRKQLEDQLRQSQKMEAIGKLAGGVAHDFNNLLTAILGYSELLLVKMTKENNYRDIVFEVKKAGERAAALTQQLLAFSRKQILKPAVLNINQVVTGLEKMLKRIIGEDIHLVSELDQNLFNVKADMGQLEQIILNLSVNAVDAMPKGGILSIKTENKNIDDNLRAVLNTGAAGDYVCISITDNGTGIEKKLTPHIFEPFFTTKPTGTGLGLSVVYGIIQQHSGWVNVYSEPGEGTTFRIYLPALALEEGNENNVTTEISLEDYRGNGECILLVEDEEGVRNVAAKALSDYGYQVIESETAQQAMDVFQHRSEELDMVLSDIVLPDQNGIELTERMKAKKPDLKILLSSGYADQRSHSKEVAEQGIPFLQKPYALGDLLIAVKDIIDGRKIR
jgi:two-component system, cell cycle sensor histidine kinase and response regulator CckA